MKKILLTLFFILSFNVRADWTEIDKNDRSTSYIEYSRSKFTENEFDVWIKTDYSSNRPINRRYEYNTLAVHITGICNQNQIKYLYSEYRLDDKFVYKDQEYQFRETVPNSNDDKLLKMMCQIGQSKKANLSQLY